MMKLRPMASLALVVISLSFLAAPRASAINLYWDANNDTLGFGTAGGTMSSTTLGTSTYGWTESVTGEVVVAGNSYNAQSNVLIFGTATDGLATGTITVSGRVPATGNVGSFSFGSASGVITFSGGVGDLMVTGNNALGMSNVQSGGAAAGVIFDVNFAASSLNSNGDNNGYVQFNKIFGSTGNITVTRGTWEHTGSSYLTDTISTPSASYSRNIGINSNSSRFIFNSTADQLFSGNITSSNTANTGAKFIKNNTSTLTLTGSASTYVGSFQISGGTLSAEHDKALGNTTLVTIDGGNLDVMGATAGTVTLGTNADVVMSSGTLTLDLGTSFDQIVGNGAGSQFDITGGTIDLNLGAGFSYANTYQVLTAFGGTNSVSGVTFTGISGYTATLGTDGVLSFVAIPEPSVVLLGGFGALLLLRRRRA